MIVLCRVQLLLDYLGFPPHTLSIPVLTEAMDSSWRLNLNNQATETLGRNMCVFKIGPLHLIHTYKASKYLTLGGGHLCKESLRHLCSLHLVLNLLVDRSADIENTTVRPQPSVSCNWGQSRLKREREERQKADNEIGFKCEPQ